MVRFAVRPDVATTLFDDPVDRGEAKAGALARRFGREERLEQTRLSRRVHSNAGVAHRQQDVWPRPRRNVAVGVASVQFDVGGFDGDHAAPRHRVACVHHQVQDNLFQLAGVGAHCPQGGRQRGAELDVFPDEPPEQLLRLNDECVHVDHARLKYLLSAKD